MNLRIPTGGLALALSSVALALPAAALAGNGGTAPPTPAADGPVDPAFALSARHTAFLGQALKVAGTDHNAAGQTVALGKRQGAASVPPAAELVAAADVAHHTR